MSDTLTTGNDQTPGAPARVEEVAVIAAGTIGVSWTALFLAHGLSVRVYDTREGIGEFVRSSLTQMSPTLAALGLPTEDLTQRLKIVDSLESAVDGAQVVQENGPEILAVKHQMLAQIEEATAADALLLSSTSAITATALAAKLRHPGRLLVAHPSTRPSSSRSSSSCLASARKQTRSAELARSTGRSENVRSSSARRFPGSSPTGYRRRCSASASTSSRKASSTSPSWMTS
jgi:hypothetical protein